MLDKTTRKKEVSEDKINSVRFDSEKLGKIKIHKKGFITTNGTMSRVGVQTYMNKKGEILKELRLPEEVFNEDSLESFNNIPVTNGHPHVTVDIENARKYQRGLTGDVTRKKNNTYTVNKITITDSELIDDINSGKHQISLGYECELEHKPGIHPVYGKYDAIQRNIRGNHAAIVYKARAGDEACLHLDSLDNFNDNVAVIINQKEIMENSKKIDEKDLEGSEDIREADKKTASIEVEKNEIDEVKKSLNTLSEEVDKLKVEKKVSEKKIEEKIETEKEVEIEKPSEEKVEEKTEVKPEVEAEIKSKEELKIKIEKEVEVKPEETKEDSRDLEIKELKLKLDSLEKSIPKKVKEHANILNLAKKVLNKECFEKTDGMNVEEIKKEIVISHCKIDVAEKSSAYIDARIDIINENLAKSKKDEAKSSEFFANVSEKKEDSLENLRAEKATQLKNNWK